MRYVDKCVQNRTIGVFAHSVRQECYTFVG